LKLLAEYIGDLRELQSVNLEEYQANKLIRKAVERTLHEYTRLDNTVVYGILKKRLGDIDEFAQKIAAYLSQSPSAKAG
jgi:uncharacterized protein YutE (UPF0331/DUF86 family)